MRRSRVPSTLRPPPSESKEVLCHDACDHWLRIARCFSWSCCVSNSPTISVKGATDVQVKHVYLVVLENHSYSSIIGNKSMPWLNALARKYAYASAYDAKTHPSIGNRL